MIEERAFKKTFNNFTNGRLSNKKSTNILALVQYHYCTGVFFFPFDNPTPFVNVCLLQLKCRRHTLANVVESIFTQMGWQKLFTSNEHIHLSNIISQVAGIPQSHCTALDQLLVQRLFSRLEIPTCM